MTIDIGTDKFKGRVADIDRAFIDIFKLETIAGSLEETLTSINNVALSEEISKRHFGKEDPIGKVITMSIENIQNDYKVTAVYRIPGNTVLDFTRAGPV